MGKIILFTALFLATIFMAQTRVNYNLKIVHPDKSERKYNMNLDVDGGKSYFYDEKLLENSKYPSKSNQFLMYQQAGNENMQIVYSHENLPFKIKSDDKIIWKVEEEFKKIDDYKVQKATTSFGGRQWTAWFCSEISMMEGPYKFRDLPGLIFELSDSENIFFYQMIGIEKFKNDTKKLSFDFNKAQEITVEKYDKLMGDFLANPFLKQRNQLGNGVELNIDDKDVRVQDLNKMTAEFHKNIKNTYPPAVEMDQFGFYREQIFQ
ncbi:hypothetical protein ASG31_09685 [Chryseobacterium sp. Leaf404]|uniref:GLPGLI family protein n=1 Tax=unclassified Chryseobacterium TaxID=2593645 RepID=UPI0006F1D2DF|nr:MULTISPECIES: GLPGLI family protein [unclassified Chryseobacterium]KQT17653.1 hypothetical protein ASG31_09685 [Chryseobacterium sp. Leaf404]